MPSVAQFRFSNGSALSLPCWGLLSYFPAFFRPCMLVGAQPTAPCQAPSIKGIRMGAQQGHSLLHTHQMSTHPQRQGQTRVPLPPPPRPLPSHHPRQRRAQASVSTLQAVLPVLYQGTSFLPPALASSCCSSACVASPSVGRCAGGGNRSTADLLVIGLKRIGTECPRIVCPHNARFINEVCTWQWRRVVAGRIVKLKRPIRQHRIRDIIRLNILGNIACWLSLIDAQNHQPLRLMVMVELLQHRCFTLAGRAIARPEVDNHRVPAKAAQLYRVSTGICQSEIRRRLAYANPARWPAVPTWLEQEPEEPAHQQEQQDQSAKKERLSADRQKPEVLAHLHLG